MGIFVTGGTGLLGGSLVRSLHAAGHRVTASGRNALRLQDLEKIQIPTCNLDYTDTQNLHDALAGHSTLVHCGALSSAWGRKEAFKTQNGDATQNLVNAAITAGIKKFIYISSSSVYFDFSNRLDLKETDPLPSEFASHYTWSKHLGEVATLNASDKMMCVILRPRGIIGAGDAALAPRLIKAAQKGLLPLPNGGKALASITCVDDVVSAIAAVIEAKSYLTGNIYNISGAKPVSVKELVEQTLYLTSTKTKIFSVPYSAIAPLVCIKETIHSALNLSEPTITKYSLGLLAFSQTLNTEALERDTGWQPKLSAADGLQAFADWWREKQ